MTPWWTLEPYKTYRKTCGVRTLLFWNISRFDVLLYACKRKTPLPTVSHYYTKVFLQILLKYKMLNLVCFTVWNYKLSLHTL